MMGQGGLWGDSPSMVDDVLLRLLRSRNRVIKRAGAFLAGFDERFLTFFWWGAYNR